MINLFVAFFVAFIASIVIIRTQKLHGNFTGDSDVSGPQKFHTTPVPRIGGSAIFLGIFAPITLNYQNNPQELTGLIFLICVIPVMGIGIAEDLSKKVSPRVRLIFIALGALLASLLLDAKINTLDIPGIDYLLSFSAVSIIFTMIAITGLANAYNIIDGFNGLASMVGIITLMGLGYIGLQFQDSSMMYLSFLMASSILGFFLWNYPRGLIFLGDGGAYLIGFWVATLSVLMVCRHAEISPWFALLLNGYPILETLFTIYRRVFHQGKSPGHPDGIHFHSLIYRRIHHHSSAVNNKDTFSANAKTAPYLWILSSLAVIPAILFNNSTPKLVGFSLLFVASYIWLYTRVVSFRTPKWMQL